MMKERANEQKLARASAYLNKNIKFLREILEITEQEEDTSASLYLAMHY